MEEQTAGAWAQSIYAQQWTQVFYRISREKYGRIADHRELAEDARQKLATRLASMGARDDQRIRENTVHQVSCRMP